MLITYSFAKSKDDLMQILALQKKNLNQIVSSEEKEKEGFVTISHTLAILEKMNNLCPHIIAKDGHSIVGYALCMHPDYTNEITLLKSMFTEIEATLDPKVNFMTMGQVCIDISYRKQGIFRKLYAIMKTAIQPEFNTIITEVASNNTRSLQAHYAIGFKDLKVYRSNRQEWHLIIWQ